MRVRNTHRWKNNSPECLSKSCWEIILSGWIPAPRAQINTFKQSKWHLGPLNMTVRQLKMNVKGQKTKKGYMWVPTITTGTILFGKQFTGYDEKWWLMCQVAIVRSLFKPPGWRRGSENIDRASIDIVVSSKWILSLPSHFIAIFLKPLQKQLSCLHVLVVCFHWPWHWTGTLRCCLGGHWGAHTAWCWMQNGGAQTSARISPFWCTCRKKERKKWDNGG